MLEIISKIRSVISLIVVIAVVLLAVLLAGVRLIGYTPYAVLSGSMMPVYEVGDLVYVKELPPVQICKGDVISFVAGENLTVVTHRVYDVDRKLRCFTTKGDANNAPDSGTVAYENVLGVVRFAIPKLGYLSMYMSTERGKYITYCVVGVLLLISLIPTPKKTSQKSNITD